MLGLMQNVPLLISSLIRHADRHHGDVEIVSRRVEGDIHRTTYRELHGRARRQANALDALGVNSSDRVATLAWNGYRHMELYFRGGGQGRDPAYDQSSSSRRTRLRGWSATPRIRYLFFDLTFLPIVEKIAAGVPDGQGLRCDDRPRPYAGHDQR